MKSENVIDDKTKKHADEINKFRTEEWLYPNNVSIVFWLKLYCFEEF